MISNPLHADLDQILLDTKDLWHELRGKHIFITGGTGFFGCWLLESFLWANDHLDLGSSATILTRNPEAFKKKVPHLASHSAINLCFGDVRSFEFPQETFSHVIHAATEASVRLNREDPLTMFEVIVQGACRVLEFARQCGAKKVLFVSSGAVYGKQPSEIAHLTEEFQGAPDLTDPDSAYGEGKRAAELLCALYAKQYGLETKIARCFAFVGPHLPLDIHFAVGNFILDGLKGRPIHIKGDGTPYRSYLYAADLATWLWTILFKGTSCRPYNVGSDEAMTIAEVAQAVSQVFNPPCQVQIFRQPVPGKAPERYVPSIDRAVRELKLRVRVQPVEAFRKSANWFATQHAGVM